MVRGEADDGIIVDWQLIRDKVPADRTQVVPSAERMRALFGEAVRGVVTDRGCESKRDANVLESYPKSNAASSRPTAEALAANPSKRLASTATSRGGFSRGAYTIRSP